MIKTLLILIFALVSFVSFSQTYGNEWINYNQKYYKFKVYRDGIYKIDYALLENAGIDMNAFTPANMQLFGKEKEQPIYIVDGGDNSFDAGDYFLFYAEHNDGWLDSLLYEDPNTIGNPNYSLYNDTICYFFTWNNQNSGNKRFLIENDQNYNAYTPAPYWLSEIKVGYASEYNEGASRIPSYSYSTSKFTAGEGWTSGYQNGATSLRTLAVNPVTSSPYVGPGAPLVKFKGLSVSNSDAQTNGAPGNHHFTWTIGSTVLHDEIYTGYDQRIVTKTFSPSLLTDGTTPLALNIIPDLGVATDYQAVSAYNLIYPKQTTLNGAAKETFYIENSTASRIRIDIANANLNSPVLFVFGEIPKMVLMTNNAGIWQASISRNPISTTQKAILSSTSEFLAVSGFSPVSPSGYFKNYANVNAERALIMVYNQKLDTATNEYAAYRSGNGGFHNVILANVEELYLQYGGGIPTHIMGIRRFSHQLYNQANDKPIALFLIGKGIREANTNESIYGVGTRRNTATYAASLVPSFGYPSSDIMITAGLEGTILDPLIPTGRISVRTNTDLRNYLEKVKTYEEEQNQFSIYNSQNKDWQKQILHFSGGSNAAQQEQFFTYMEGMRNTIEDSLFAGNVTTFRKLTSDPFNPAQTSEMRDRIADGVSIMNFFGHASAQGFDINIDEPALWGNTGKYPVVIGNGCLNGNIFQPFDVASIRYLNEINLGAIAFISPVNYGFDFHLNLYSSELYRNFSYKDYGGNLSHQMQKTIQELQIGNPDYPNYNNIYYHIALTQMNLNGDPLLKVNWHAKPEIELTAENITFLPETIDLQTDSIEMRIVIKNLGQSIVDSVLVEVVRDFPFTTIDSTYTLFIPRLNYTDTLRFMMPVQANIGVGLNNFSVKVDIPSTYEEQFDETSNNQITKTLFIKLDGIVPVYPYEFAVVPRDSVAVKGSTIDPIAAYKNYRFELDTTDLFNSPQKRIASVSGLGGIKTVLPSQWKNTNGQSFPLVCEDSTVYFWRCSVDSSVLFWRESSFQYIPGKAGWGQDHFFQFKNNDFYGVQYDRTNRLRNFDSVYHSIKCNVYDNATGLLEVASTNFLIDEQQKEYGFCFLNPSLHAVVIDPVNFKTWLTRHPNTPANLSHYFGNINDNGSCRNRSEGYFIFRQNSASQLAGFQTMMSSVPEDYYILVYTARYAEYDNWNTYAPQLSETMYQTFANLGSDSIIPGRSNRAFIFFTQKGHPEKSKEILARNSGDYISLGAVMSGRKEEGNEFSPFIGPAQKWETVYWKQDPLENPTLDTTKLLIKLYDAQQNWVLDYEYEFTRKDSLLNINSFIPATQYPYIRLQANYKDSLYTPAQVDRWHVLYQPIPEAAIDGSTAYTWLPVDSINQGQDIKFAVDILNISDYPMDSLLVRYWVQGSNQQIIPIPYLRQDSLRVSGVLRDTITFSTASMPGINSLWMEVNPYINGSVFITDQPEQYHFNNLLQLPFYVKGDDLNPILDVTFDGMHILNGDIVNPNSEISISLKDDNPYLVMDNDSDTTLFGIFLTSPDGVQKRIPFMDGQGNNVMQWIPAEGQYKRFKILYPAAFEQNGTYTLLVQGTDRSGNISGDLEYRISFEVIHESSISYLMNYPNPFSTSTRFVFTLTGSSVPDEMIIQIMTVTGKVVREITEDEIGPMRIGRNVSEYAWDGRDEFGDPLANGVYLYRVLTQIKGEDIKHRESGADQYFKKEFGKMYLMR